MVRSSFEEFQESIRKNQKQKSVRTVMRWNLHDADKCEGIVKQPRVLIDGLQDISRLRGVWSEWQARLKAVMESMADVERLQLVRDAAG